MRRTWVKFYCDQWLRGSIRQEPIEVRAIFTDLLAMAGDNAYGDDGIIQLAENVGFSDELIAGILNVPLKTWISTKERLSNHPDTEENRIEIISLHQGFAIRILKWQCYQSEYQRQKPYRQAKKKENTPQTPLKERNNIEGDVDIDIEEKVTQVTKEVTKDTYDIINYWNSKGIKALEERETKVKKKTIPIIRTSLKDYSLDEIKEAIDNYVEILRSEDHYFSHKWQLWEFLDRGLVNFLSKSEPRKNYLRDKEYRSSQVGKNLRPVTGRESQYEEAREAKIVELQEKYEKDNEEAMKEKDRDKLDEIENKINDEMAAFSRDYWDKGERKKEKLEKAP